MIGPAGTIYRDGTGFNEDLRIEVDLAKMKFIKELKTSETLSINIPCKLRRHATCSERRMYLQHECILNSHNNGDRGYASGSDDAVRHLQRRANAEGNHRHSTNSFIFEHNYPYPKNIMIICGDPERVV
ncbi:hypothetical protein ACJ72_08217 [Emergomyces africanus]|uniref:Uncharacterized protein n=1 Tax=Emergomyces africanus TaxID=1955775 RepID=A0A1B7NL28_9EURO|nr:hypothetical protein ACJ72_08217 [Emergomyces africanus]